MESEMTESAGSGALLSVVVPCFNESKVIRMFYVELKRVLQAEKDLEHEIIFVDDGSSDDTLMQLNQIACEDGRVRVCSLSRNFGHQIALTAGLDAAVGDAVVMIDADLQHPPELIPQMINKWKEGYDIVSAVRDSTEGVSYFKKITSGGFYLIVNLLSEIPIPRGAADFNLLSRRVCKVLRNMPERHRFLRGMTSWVGFSRTFLSYTATKRAGGESKYTLMKMITLALDAIFSFSAAPLRMATKLGLMITLFGLLFLMYMLGRYLWWGDTVRGWASMIGITLILGGFNLVSVGLLGQYLSRVFEEVKGRPIYIFKQEPTCFMQSHIEQGREKGHHKTEVQTGSAKTGSPVMKEKSRECSSES
ncbi:MAG: glycosyltransferase family 2 protein [Phycisphaerae bacterium]|nr:glycosyltransferase family 2 protein [Phycisphaerae bacterium]